MKIVLAVDGSRYSHWAVDLLLHIPLADTPEIHVLHVVDVEAITHPFLTPRLAPQYRGVIQTEVEKNMLAGNRLVAEVGERLRARWNIVQSVVERGHVAEQIIAKAKQEEADLIILGSRGRSDIAAFLMGSVSQKVATYAPCSVLVVKRKRHIVKKILVAVDGSTHSDAAVEFLHTHFLPGELHAIVLHVWDHPFNPPELPGWLPVEKRCSHAMVEAGFKARPLFLRGHTAETIVEAANRKRVDLVVIGSRGLTGLKRYFLGGVSHKVTKYSERSVLVIKRR